MYAPSPIHTRARGRYRADMERNDRSKYLIPFLVTMLAVILILGAVVLFLTAQVDTPL